MCLDVARRRTLFAHLNHETEDLEADRVPEGAELFRVTFERRGHEDASTIFELEEQALNCDEPCFYCGDAPFGPNVS